MSIGLCVRVTIYINLPISLYHGHGRNIQIDIFIFYNLEHFTNTEEASFFNKSNAFVWLC